MSRVVVQDQFARYGREFDRACRRALLEGAQATLDVARVTVPKGETGKLERSLHLGHMEETPARLRVEVVAAQFYGRFLEFGTLGSRKRALKRPEARRSTGQGIKPRYFMLHAGRIAAPQFTAALSRQLRNL
jgi:hypothetical protein